MKRKDIPTVFLPKTKRGDRKIKRKDVFYVYIVRCANGTYYTGYTNNLENRIKLHNKGDGAKYLKGKAPVELVYAKEYRYYKNALHAERNMKKLTRRQKEILIENYDSRLRPPLLRFAKQSGGGSAGVTPVFRFSGKTL